MRANRSENRRDIEGIFMPVATNVPERIAQLKQKLKARAGKKEYDTNCEHIRAEIERLEAGGSLEFDL